MKTTFLAALLAVGTTLASAAPVTLTMEGIAAPGTATSHNNDGFTSQGFTVTMDHGHVLDSAYSPASYAFNNGSDWLLHDASGALRINRADGALFAFSQFDFGHYSHGGATSVTLTGFYADGNMVTRVLSFTDSIQTLALGSAWTGLNRVQFVGNFNQAYDNFVFNASATVPEPASLALVGLALAAVGAARRRRG